MYGTQTKDCVLILLELFENDVEMYGTQTQTTGFKCLVTFENDVEMYGTQTEGYYGSTMDTV